MRQTFTVPLVPVFVLSLLLAQPLPGAENFTTIDYPGAARTSAYGINEGGDIAGDFTAAGVIHGFLLSGGKFTQIDFPEAKQTWASGINSTGAIVGQYADSNGKMHGFLLSKGVFSSLDYPGADQTWAYGINSNGDIVGMIQVPGKLMQGFLLRNGVWTVLEYRPDAPSSTMSCYFGINDAGVAVGHWGTRTAVHGTMHKNGAFTQFDYGGGGQISAVGINNSGDTVGNFYDSSQVPHGFLLRIGRFASIDFPGSDHTMAYGINNSGQIVGHYRDAEKRIHGFVARVAPAGPSQVLAVDDDGGDCPGALRTIQEAVAQAAPGSTIEVCPGTYRGTVNIIGPEKTGLKLIGMGRQDEVVLQGDYTEPDGFHLENVTNVLIRGFTVRDFGNKPTTDTEWGSGRQIYLENAHYNTIEHNRLINGDHWGILLVNSGNNTIQQNVAFADNSSLANCGIHVQGPKSAGNTVRLNMTYGNNVAGIMIWGAGPDNVVADNTLLGNGRYGILIQDTEGARIEGNRVSYGRGAWGKTPLGKEPGIGIDVQNSTKVTVFDNRLRNNSGGDLDWDGKGENIFDSNACNTSTPAGACGR